MEILNTNANTGAYASALSGINNGQAAVNDTANSIANTALTKEGNLTKDFVELRKQENVVKANMQVIKTVKDVEEHIIDIMA